MANMGETALILIVDDDADDRLLIRKGLERRGLRNPIREVTGGEELLDYLKQRGRYADPERAPRPDLTYCLTSTCHAWVGAKR